MGNENLKSPIPSPLYASTRAYGCVRAEGANTAVPYKMYGAVHFTQGIVKSSRPFDSTTFFYWVVVIILPGSSGIFAPQYDCTKGKWKIQYDGARTRSQYRNVRANISLRKKTCARTSGIFTQVTMRTSSCQNIFQRRIGFPRAHSHIQSESLTLTERLLAPDSLTWEIWAHAVPESTLLWSTHFPPVALSAGRLSSTQHIDALCLDKCGEENATTVHSRALGLLVSRLGIRFAPNNSECGRSCMVV